MTSQTYPDGTPLAPGDSLEDNPQGGWAPTPAEEGQAAARLDYWKATLHSIAEELQTWNTDLLLTMEPFTHGEGNRLIRLELGNRGVGKSGKWVGFDKAREEWVLTP